MLPLLHLGAPRSARFRSGWMAGVAAALLVAAFVFASSAQAQPHTKTRFLRWTYQDAAGLVLEGVPQAMPYALGGGAALLSLSPLDPALSTEGQQMRGGPLSAFFSVANALGHNRMMWPAAGLFATSLVTDDARFQDAAFTSLQSLLYTRMVVSGLKGIAGRIRPKAREGAYAFEPMGGPTSFPSGHTATAFALVTPWVVYYPNAATYGLLALSTGTALTRVVQQKHWPTDVLAGAAIGTLVGAWLARQHQRHAHAAPGRSALRVTPAVGPGGMALHLRVRLD